MNKSHALLSLLLWASAAASGQTIDQLKWTSGCWLAESGARKIQENWRKISHFLVGRMPAGATWVLRRSFKHLRGELINIRFSGAQGSFSIKI